MTTAKHKQSSIRSQFIVSASVYVCMCNPDLLTLREKEKERVCVYPLSHIHCLYVLSCRRTENPLTVSNKSSRNELCILWLNSIDLQQDATVNNEKRTVRRMPKNTKWIESGHSSHQIGWWKQNVWKKWNGQQHWYIFFSGQFLDLSFEFWWCVCFWLCRSALDMIFRASNLFLLLACAFFSAFAMFETNYIEVTMSHWMSSKCILNDLNYDGDFNTRKLRKQWSAVSTNSTTFIQMHSISFSMHFARWKCLLIWSSHIIWMPYNKNKLNDFFFVIKHKMKRILRWLACM